MIRAVPIALLLALLSTPVDAADLASLRAAAAAYPQDYGAQQTLARAAEEAGERDLALIAWQAAFDASHGNLESSLGRALALLNLGRIPEGRAAARAAARAFPESAAAQKTLAGAHRHAATNLPGSWGLVAADRAYVRAFSLSPDDDTRCGRAWNRLALDAPLVARQDFAALLLKNPGDACAVDGTAATRPMFRFGGGFSLNGSLYQDHPSNLGGFNALIFGRISFADLVFAEVAGRFLGIAQSTDTGTQDYRQDEIWGRVGVAHGGFGAQVLAGALGATTSTSTIPAVGGQAWASFGATLRLEGTWAQYDDGEALRAGLGLRVPVLSMLSLDGGVDLSGLIDDSGDPTPQVSAHLSAILRLGPMTLQPGFRAGNEIRPLRIDEPSLWNTTSTLEASAFLKGSAALNPNLDLSFGYEVLRFQPADGSDVRHTHVLSIGIAGHGSGGLRK